MSLSSAVNRSGHPPCQRGFTLVELMVALLIGVFLTAGVLALFAATKQSYRINEGVSRVQESGRFAIDYMSRDLRLAGFTELGTTLTSNFVMGWNGASSAPSGAMTAGVPSSDYEAQTDVLSISYIEPLAAATTHTILYYIAEGASGEPGLFRKEDSATSQELLEGVYDMQIRYGLDTTSPPDGQLDSYADADTVTTGTNWPNVVAVRIDLLLGSSEGNLADSPMSLPYARNDGSFFSAASGDLRLYQMFSTTVALRNRLP
ncbi:prepilin-type N-terminal cleavage/methylation domain-containing protein [Thioflavicoccus mobilis 8321]|uniref:Prepilin-type N-terminal cleavage/methylation domain-containing protein n=1 Tax=Thioflavicoccus mobilis 8321 TaxID=765912 RepID=L0H1B1_9GAMM|nr:PilW family protein [Thioflavicoccus mobilis]AGA91847.1 prepilin-type N-terminal cleavage/methylation domain-containing protein [Thioflavicoccus mobilis 8321]